MVDYSKWKKIEISDDEDDTHPNIDTPSLFRWRHQARLQRQEEQRKANEEVEKKRALLKQKLQEQENEKEKELSEEERQKLAEELAETERKEKELQKRQARQPWNVDTIGQETWSGTVLNKNVLNKPKTQEEITYEKEADVIGYEGHVAAYEAEMRQFAFQANFEERRRYLVAHPNLVHQYTVDYLSLWCISLKLEGKQALLECVARQAVTIQMILSLASTLGGGIDPRSCLGVFFERSARAKAKFERMFEDELAEFMERVSKAEQYRLEKALAEQEKDPQALIGPGGLNAQEVFESLPEQLQECFQTRSHEHIERVLGAMDPEEAEYHLKRCIDAGLWSVEAGKDDVDEDEQQLIAAMARSSLKDNEDKVDGSGGDADSSSSLSEEE